MSTQPMVKITGVAGGLDSANLDDENNLVPVQTSTPLTQFMTPKQEQSQFVAPKQVIYMINKYLCTLN